MLFQQIDFGFNWFEFYSNLLWGFVIFIIMLLAYVCLFKPYLKLLDEAEIDLGEIR